MGNSNSAVLPTFDGSSPAETFDTIVRAKALELGWTNEETAKNAIRAFEGPALTWYEVVSLKNDSLSKNWNVLREAFLQKFKMSGNLSEQIAGMFLEAKIPTFSGLDIKAFPVQKFILSVENMATLRSWSDKEIFKNALESLTGKAALDIQAEKGLGNSWENLRRKLLELYGPHMSLDERVKALRQLSQKGIEICNDFFSRIDSEMLLIEEDVLKSAASDDQREAMMRIHKLYSALFFVQGMNYNVRQRLLKMPVSTGKEKIPSLDEIILTAKTMEQYENVERSQKAILKNIKKENQPENSKPKPKQTVPTAQGSTQKAQAKRQRKPSLPHVQPQQMGPAAFQGPFDSGFYMPPTSNGVPQASRAYGKPFPNYPGVNQTFPSESSFMLQPPPPYSKTQKK